MCEGSFLPSSFGPHQKHTEFESSLRSYPIKVRAPVLGANLGAGIFFRLFDLHYPSLPLHAVPVATSLPFSGFKAKRCFSGFLCRCRSLTEKTISGSPLHKKGRLAAAHVFPDG